MHKLIIALTLAVTASFPVVAAEPEYTLTWDGESTSLVYGPYSYKMVPVPSNLYEGMPAVFQMGYPSKYEHYEGYDWYRAGNHPHKVTLTEPYYIGATEVPQWLWKAVMGNNPSVFNGDTDEYPVENVSYNDIQEFLTRLNGIFMSHYRLPTEAEWEFAAREGRTDTYPYLFSGAKNSKKVAWTAENSGGVPHPVGSLAPNALGIYDMSGNMIEWCSDYYEPLKAVPLKGPTGPEDGKERVIRSSSFIHYASPKKSGGTINYIYGRRGEKPDVKCEFYGFRLANNVFLMHAQ